MGQSQKAKHGGSMKGLCISNADTQQEDPLLTQTKHTLE